MIRINLLPQKRHSQREEGSQLWLGIILGLMALEVVACLLLFSFKQKELDQQVGKNAVLSEQIAQSKKKVKEHPIVKERLAILRAREDAIAKLQSARTGPTAVMLEIARLMTKGRGPSIDPERLSTIERENPLAMFNPAWDTRNLWLTDFIEQQRVVKLSGLARDGEDVSELARRMSLSAYFYDVKLLPAARQQDSKSSFEWVSFKLQAQVRY